MPDSRQFLFFIALSLLAFVAIAQGWPYSSSISAEPTNPYFNPYEARSYPDKLEVFKDDKKIGVIRSEQRNIERWGFINSGNHMVVRSRGVEGPAIIELFETATCTRVDKLVMSSEQKRSPEWAADFLK